MYNRLQYLQTQDDIITGQLPVGEPASAGATGGAQSVARVTAMAMLVDGADTESDALEAC